MQKINVILFANQILKDEQPKANVIINGKLSIFHVLESCCGLMEQYKIQIFIFLPEKISEYMDDILDTWHKQQQDENNVFFKIHTIPTSRNDYDASLLSHLLRFLKEKFWDDSLCLLLSLNYPLIETFTLEKLVEMQKGSPVCLVKKLYPTLPFNDEKIYMEQKEDNLSHFVFTKQPSENEYMFVSVLDSCTFLLIFDVSFNIHASFYTCIFHHALFLPTYSMLSEGQPFYSILDKLQIENFYLRQELQRISRKLDSITNKPKLF